jgi:hypothetical protein
MNDFMIVTLTAISLGLLLIPFFIVLSALFPVRTAKIMEVITRMPGRSFSIGLVNFLFFLAVAMLLFSLSEQANGLLKGILFVLALAITIILSVSLSLGLTGMATVIGERITPTQSPWRRTLWGALLLGLSCAVPLLGWFLLLPAAAWAGMGAFIIVIFQKPEK